MHTHFGSATAGLGAFLSVLLFGTFWRLGWAHVGAKARSRHLKGLAGAALSQF